MATIRSLITGPLRLLPYVWPLRVPLLAATFLVLFPFASFTRTLRPYLSGLFDPIDDAAFVLITVSALFNAWAIALVARLVLAHGPQRLGLPGSPWRFFPVAAWVWLAAALLAAPTVCCAIAFASSSGGTERTPIRLALVALGIAIATVALLATLWFSARVDRIGKRLRQRPARTFVERSYEAVLAQLARFPSVSSGFLAPVPGGVELVRGHGLAFFLGLTSFLLYVVTGFVTRNQERPVIASTLTYVLLLSLVTTWVAGFAAFLLDRSRVPLLAYLLLWVVFVDTVVDRVAPSDHVYRTVPMPAAMPRATPDELLRGSDPVVLVATSGGGIQAAAWTTRALTSLTEIPDVDRRLRLVSAVSGGSVGTMYAIAGMDACGPSRVAGGRPYDANAVSRQSSLHAIGWGLVFKDLPRTVAPVFSNPFVDRGSVLEDAWKREARLQKPFPDPAPLLSQWRVNVAQRQCPAVIYNAMVAETGQPMLFSTAALPDRLRPFDFYTHYRDRDVPVTTAVRLSAGFPFVSPATRADADGPKGHFSHVVDGGYFDNYGIESLTTWLHAGLNALDAASRPTRILVIEICDLEPCSARESADGPARGGARRGWPYQAIAPLEALVAMRTAAQKVRNRSSLRLLKDYWRTQKVCVASREVSFTGPRGPLSWHLTRAEASDIDAVWRKQADGHRQFIGDFLAGRPTEACP